MIISFCGHSKFHKTEEYEKKILSFLEEKVGNNSADMYLGGYGDFDEFAYQCCKKYQEKHPLVSLVFVTPYLSVEYQRNHLEHQKERYDSILYPELESKPPRFAIIYRNRYMVDHADFVVAFVAHNWGGAYTTYKYAKRKNKPIYNLARFEE
ncbi:MAG: hypothetical protein E7643_03785 [Ruminococcaceae bacterium]|nr:hypothetical protein [Oscillospiraceae bacterium]